MNKRSSQRSCPDCDQPLQEIHLFTRTMENPISGAAYDSDMYYAQAHAKRSAFLAKYDKAGIVKAYICESCTRIFMYGISTP